MAAMQCRIKTDCRSIRHVSRYRTKKPRNTRNTRKEAGGHISCSCLFVYLVYFVVRSCVLRCEFRSLSRDTTDSSVPALECGDLSPLCVLPARDRKRRQVAALQGSVSRRRQASGGTRLVRRGRLGFMGRRGFGEMNFRDHKREKNDFGVPRHKRRWSRGRLAVSFDLSQCYG